MSEHPPENPWAAPVPAVGGPEQPPTPAWQAPPPAWPPAPGQPWATPAFVQPPQRPLNPWAVVCLVTGILPLVPIAIAAGITSLVQNKRRPMRGNGLAIAGLTLSGLWLVGIAVIVIVGLNGGFDYRQGPVSTVGKADVGACLQLHQGSGPATPVDCDSTHAIEVYAVHQLSADESWPGESAVDDEAYDFCGHSFEPYVGEGDLLSDYDWGYYSPDELEWSAGEHRVVCVIIPSFPDHSLQGTARGSG